MAHLDTITFSAGGGDLDRASHLRAEAHALVRRDDARVLPLAAGRLLIDLATGAPKLGWQAAANRTGDAGPTVFLGMVDGAPRFATETGFDEDAARALVPEGHKFIDLRSVAGQLSPGEATIGATAKGVLGWHGTHTHCARCGHASDIDDGGWRRRCPACGALHFPRTDPVVIMLVLDGDDALIGRQSSWPPGLHSLLAGFMEPGETIADAVRRETLEESAIKVGRVRFLADQPWPFPSSMMLGCVAEALSREITIDPTEIEAAMWVPRSEMARILAGDHPDFASPRVDAIARSILTAWVSGEIEPF